MEEENLKLHIDPLAFAGNIVLGFLCLASVAFLVVVLQPWYLVFEHVRWIIIIAFIAGIGGAFFGASLWQPLMNREEATLAIRLLDMSLCSMTGAAMGALYYLQEYGPPITTHSIPGMLVGALMGFLAPVLWQPSRTSDDSFDEERPVGHLEGRGRSVALAIFCGCLGLVVTGQLLDKAVSSLIPDATGSVPYLGSIIGFLIGLLPAAFFLRPVKIQVQKTETFRRSPEDYVTRKHVVQRPNSPVPWEMPRPSAAPIQDDEADMHPRDPN